MLSWEKTPNLVFLAWGQNQEWDKRRDSILAIRNQERRGLPHYSIAWAVGGRPSSVSGTPPSSALAILSPSNKLPGEARVISNCSYIYSVTFSRSSDFQSSHVWADACGPRWATLGPAVARADDGRPADNGPLLIGQQVEVVEEVAVVVETAGEAVAGAGGSM